LPRKVDTEDDAMHARWLVALTLSLWCTLAAGQHPIYESQGPSGPVFSDQPSPGAREVILPPPNVVVVPPLPPPETDATAPADPPAPYTALAIASPAEGDTIHTNTGAFDVTLKIAPFLRDGDRIELKLDGTVLRRAFRSTAISVTEDDWQSAAAENVQHTLQAAILDQNGNLIVESPVVSFYAHRATIHRGRR
jgi:hypothetical protein